MNDELKKQIERFLPIVAAIPGVGSFLAAGPQSYFNSANQRRMDELETALRYQIDLVNQKLYTRISKEYIESDAFIGNIMQAIRATETAESNEKIKIIADALAGCILDFTFNKTICMRIIDQITAEEMKLLIELVKIEGVVVDFYRPILESVLQAINPNANVLIIGLTQLGMTEIRSVSAQPRKWSSTPLARQVVELCTVIDTV